MKKSNISRRGFMKGLATTALSATVIPSWAWAQDLTPKSSMSGEGSGRNVATLPKFFDCNKYFGMGFPKHTDFPGIPDLLSHMNRLGIDRAVVWHTDARNTNPMPGNEQLLREIESSCAQDRIIPSFIIAPSMIKDSGVMDRFLDIVKTQHMHAFHFFPDKSGSSLSDIAPVIRAILPFNPVLFLNCFEGLDNIDDILNFSEEFPQISIIYTNAMWVHYENLYKLMEARNNIFMDTSLLHTYRTIEYVIQRFGVERLIFGAGYKSNNGASIASLVHSEVNLEQAQLIAHSNLERLMRIESPLSGNKPIIGDRLWHRLLRREHLGPEIIDAHTHLSRTIADWNDHGHTDIDTHARYALQSMDNMGVHTMIIAEYTTYDPDLTVGRTYLEEHMSQYGDRFMGYFCGLASRLVEREKLFLRLDELFSRLYYVGFKMHNNSWQIPVTDPCFIPIWEYADIHRLPILLHTWNDNYDAPKMLQEIVPRYPNAIFILGHSGNADRPDAEKLAQDNSNVYLEWCGSFLNTEDWCETLERLGNRRLVYGSDFISWETQWGHSDVWEMGRLLSLNVPDETLIPILGANMRDILARKR